MCGYWCHSPGKCDSTLKVALSNQSAHLIAVDTQILDFRQTRMNNSRNLTHSQKYALGKSFPKEIWSDDFSALYDKVDVDEIFEDDEVQSYSDFVRMGEMLPDDEGNGRNVVEANRRTIGVLPIGELDVDDLSVQRLVRAIEAYFYLPVEMMRSVDLEKIDGILSVVDRLEGVSLPLKLISKHKIDVYSLLDVVVEYVGSHHFSVVAMVGRRIAESDNPRIDITGRSFGGSRVAVVHVTEDMKENVITAFHELLHTFGIDHCVSFQCIMNSASSNCIHLCPVDMRKLQLAIGFDIKEREMHLLQFYREMNWKRDYKWTKSKLKILNDIEKKSKD